MAWTFVRPADTSLLAGRPLLDLGTGDGQTIVALTSDDGLRVGIDRSVRSLRAARRAGLVDVVAALADGLPFASSSFSTVVAGDVFHHADDQELVRILTEAARVLAGGGRLVAWWYSAPGRGGAGDPRFPRAYVDVCELAVTSGFSVGRPLDLELSLDPAPATVGIVAQR